MIRDTRNKYLTVKSKNNSNTDRRIARLSKKVDALADNVKSLQKATADFRAQYQEDQELRSRYAYYYNNNYNNYRAKAQAKTILPYERCF